MEHTHNEIVLAHEIWNLQQQINDLRGTIKLRDAKIMKLKGDIYTLKSLIGHQNLFIESLNHPIEDINYETKD
jgi:peptidoglycan hydrolase CwlO-like protein